MPEIKPPAIDPMPKRMANGVVIAAGDNDGRVTITLDELANVRDIIRNNALCEVLSTVTDMLNPGGNSPAKELTLVEVLRAVNDMRTEKQK